MTVVIDKSTHAILGSYAGAPNPAAYVNTWADPANTLHVATDQPVAALTVAVSESDGAYVVTLTVDPAKLITWKQSQNAAALSAYSMAQSASCEAAVSALLGSEDDTTHLMLAIADLFTYIEALQTKLTIADADLSSDGQSAKTDLITMQTGLMAPIQTARAARDAAIAAFTPPNTDVSPLYPTTS